jgi:hypothetical protein
MEKKLEIVTTPDDRRDSLRQPAVTLKFVVEDETGTQHEAEIRDVSRTGLRFRAGKSFTEGSAVVLHPPAGHDLLPCKAQIMRHYAVMEAGEKTIEYGVRFLEWELKERHAWFLKLRERQVA